MEAIVSIKYIVLPVVLSTISMMHFESRLISRLLKGRTRTATLTDDIFLFPFGQMAVMGSSWWSSLQVDPVNETPLCQNFYWIFLRLTYIRLVFPFSSMIDLTIGQRRNVVISYSIVLTVQGAITSTLREKSFNHIVKKRPIKQI